MTRCAAEGNLQFAPLESDLPPRGAPAIADSNLPVQRLLRHCTLCQGLTNEELRRLVEALREASYPAGEVVYRYGEPGRSMYLIAEGRVRVTLPQPDGSERVLEFLGQGDHFGDMALLTDNIRPATITAVVDSRLLELDQQGFDRLLREVPRFSANLSRALVRRLELEMTRKRRRERPVVVGLVNTSPRTQGVIRPLAEALARRHESMEILSDCHEPWPTQGQYLVERIPALSDSADRIRLVRERIHQVSGVHDRVLLELTLAGLETELPQMLAPCEEIWWLVESRFAEEATSRLRTLLDAAPQLAQRMHIIWTLNHSERFSPRFPDDLNISTLNFKVTLSDDLEHPSWRSRQSTQRLVRHLRGTRLGVALSGGGARGLAHLGVLRALDREGIHFDMAAGASSGALMGLAYCGGWRPDDALEEFRRVLSPPRWMWLLPKGLRWFLWWKFYHGAWDALLRPYLQDARLEQLPMPLYVLAVDLASGKQVVRERGDCIHAVLESINLPYFSHPIRRDLMELVDGGVLNNLPGDVLPERGADFVVGIDVAARLPTDFGAGSSLAAKAKTPGVLETLLRVTEVQAFGLTALRAHSIDLLIAPDTSAFQFGDFGRAAELAEAGERAAEEVLPQLKQALDNLESGKPPRPAASLGIRSMQENEK